jgi:16S rRNA (adenine1518-N6/adenine1519-N6)-dimethyltransferase
MAERKRVKPAAQRGAMQASYLAVPNELPPARKSLGQNFLADHSASLRIVEALGDISQKTVVEIGPGRGALTSPLVQRAGYVVAIELDRVLAAQLRMKYANTPNIEIIEADVLDIDFGSLLGPRPGRMVTGLAAPEIEKVSVVGNIPYYITSDILLRLFRFQHLFDCIVIMVQKEVADRIVAKPGTRDYGLLSATCQLYAKPQKLFTLPPGAFSPPPKVESSVLRLVVEPRFGKLHIDTDGFINFLKLSFGQKRKTLLNNLKQQYETAVVRAALDKAKLAADVRAEAVSLEKAATVFRTLTGEQV